MCIRDRFIYSINTDMYQYFYTIFIFHSKCMHGRKQHCDLSITWSHKMCIRDSHTYNNPLLSGRARTNFAFYPPAYQSHFAPIAPPAFLLLYCHYRHIIEKRLNIQSLFFSLCHLFLFYFITLFLNPHALSNSFFFRSALFST